MALNKKKSNEGKAIAEKNKFDAENPFKEFWALLNQDMNNDFAHIQKSV